MVDLAHGSDLICLLSFALFFANVGLAGLFGWRD